MSGDTYKNFLRLKLREERLRDFDFPRPNPNGKDGEVKFYGDHHGFEEGGRQQDHGCCGRSYGSKGCRNAPSHVYEGNMYLDVSGYKQTEELPGPNDGEFGVYAIDTESVHTKNGLELCKITMIDPKLKVVYDEYCIPPSEIIDYNTIWSGVTASKLEGVTKTFDDVRNDVLKLVSKETVLIGHGLKHDLISLKLIHDNIVDTLILYPHNRGLPFKRSLKDIAFSVLGKDIQAGEGHDSMEDAKATMQLALRKI